MGGGVFAFALCPWAWGGRIPAMTLRYRWHRALGHLWWHTAGVVQQPLYWPPRSGRGELVYGALWPVFGRVSDWCVQRARMHWHLAGGGSGGG